MENKIIAMSMVTYSNLVKKERLELALFVNVQKQVLRDDNGILLPKLLWPTVRKNCSSDREKVLKFEAEGGEFFRSLEQFIQTVKSQNNFW